MRKSTPYLFLIILLASSFYALDYQTDRMNFPPDESRLHTQTLINDGNTAIIVNATIPNTFNLSSTDCTQINTTYLSCSIPSNSTKYYSLTSPLNCTENTLYYSQLTGNITNKFTFVCIPDNKITDCKTEYGHGDANYLSEPYISTEPTTIFNLLRVWNIGHFLSPNEDAKNATATCIYENYPVRTYGRVELTYETNQINGTFLWDTIEGGYWFRIGVVSQDLQGKNIGDTYNISCNNLSYQFNHHQVIAKTTSCNLEIRNKEPFTCTLTPHPVFSSRSILTLKNNETYKTEDLSFDRLLNDAYHTETYQRLNPGETISYLVDNSTSQLTVFYIPSWYTNSFSPLYYKQVVPCTAPNLPPVASTIPDQAWLINTNNSNAFDLDNYFSDPENDNLTYTYTNVSNITVIIDANNSVTFIPDVNFTGTRYITFYTNDSYNNLTASNNVTLTVYKCGDSSCDVGETCSNCPQDCGSCGGGGGGGGKKPTPGPQPILPEPRPIPKEKSINLTLISYPQSITIKDSRFPVFAEVKNTGGLPLQDVRLEVKPVPGWNSPTIYLGDLNPGEKKIIEVLFLNQLCAGDYFTFLPYFQARLTARDLDVQDSQIFSTSITLPELTVLTDQDLYSEGDVMRLCIIYNNLADPAKDQLEFEVNVFYQNNSHYLIDYLSSYNVAQDKILLVIKDYLLDHIPITDFYTVDVDLFGQGELFSPRYQLAEGQAEPFFNGIIEDKILQRENTIYEFRYNNQPHSLKINSFTEDYISLTVYSSPLDLNLHLMDSRRIDLDEDGQEDISLTYLGIEENKADLRIKILPKAPRYPVLVSESYQLSLGESTPQLRKPVQLKVPLKEQIKSILVRGALRVLAVLAVLFLSILLMKGIFNISPQELYHRNKPKIKLFYEKNKKKIRQLIFERGA
ncbi:MAG: Ig-like domain-containing protein [Candidatus Woesearchaeota archaeon]